MKHRSRSGLSPLAAALWFILAAGCASNSPQQVSNSVGTECPPGHTLTCETRTTGRIHHGSFGKDNERCACVSADQAPMISPAIPSIRQ